MRSSSRHEFQEVLEVGARDAVAADAHDDARAVSEDVEDFGGDGKAHAAALGEDGDFAGIEDARIVAADGPDLHAVDGIDDADRGRTDDPDLVFLGGLEDLGGVAPGQTLGQDVHELDAVGGDGLDRRVLGALAGHGNEARVDFGMLRQRIGHGVVNGQSVDVLAALARRDARHDVGAVVEHLHRDPATLFSRDALDQNARILVDQDAHLWLFLCFSAWWMTMRAESATEVAMPRR